MSNTIKFCSCKSCKAGRHCKGSKAITKRSLRRLRHQNKIATNQMREDKIIYTISIPYTD